MSTRCAPCSPTVPTICMGMCGGAHIAAEMTRALEANGQRAGFLGIVNTWGFYTISRLYYRQSLDSTSPATLCAGRVAEVLRSRDPLVRQHPPGQPGAGGVRRRRGNDAPALAGGR